MDNYYYREPGSTPPAPHENQKIAGCLMVFVLMILAGFMAYSVYLSSQSPNIGHFTPTPGTETGGDTTISPSPRSSSSYLIPDTPDHSQTPEPVSTPEPVTTPTTTPTATPKASPTAASTPKATPKASPTQKSERRFSGANPDGPPPLDRVYGDIFRGKSGKAFITIHSDPKVWHGVRVFLIDNREKTYRDLQFTPEKDKQNVFKAAVPPGDYTLKLVKSGFFTFSDSFVIDDGLIAEIADPMDKRPSLNIKTNPPGAKVYFDDALAGVTPTVVDNLEEKKYSVRVVLDGYKTETLPITFSRGREVVKNLKLEKK